MALQYRVTLKAKPWEKSERGKITGILPPSLNHKGPFPHSLAIGPDFFCRKFYLLMPHNSVTMATQSRKKWEKPALFLTFFNLQGPLFQVFFFQKRVLWKIFLSVPPAQVQPLSQLWREKENPKTYPQMGHFKFGWSPQFTCYCLSFKVRELLFAFWI